MSRNNSSHWPIYIISYLKTCPTAFLSSRKKTQKLPQGWKCWNIRGIPREYYSEKGSEGYCFLRTMRNEPLFQLTYNSIIYCPRLLIYYAQQVIPFSWCQSVWVAHGQVVRALDINWAVEGVFGVPRLAFETGLSLVQQFSHLQCCQCAETYSNVSSIQNRYSKGDLVIL